MARQRSTFIAEPRVSDKAFAYSDDECVQRLAALIEHKDSKNFAEIARLISRLAVPIE